MNTQKSFGYAHKGYAESLSEFGEPLELPRSGGWILKRPIPRSSLYDAMGCYPLFACRNWRGLRDDIEDFKNELVCLSLVTDPFGSYNHTDLSGCFTDLCLPYKDHLVADVKQPIERIVSKSHRATVRRALRRVRVERCSDPMIFFDDWLSLFTELCKRYNISGIRKFSPSSFRKQFSVPGIELFRAIADDNTTVGMDIWYSTGEVAYGHLVACSELGYALRASYAMKWFVLEYFKNRVGWLDFGGLSDQNQGEGLKQYKMGWSTGVRTTYLCGRIFNRSKYAQLQKSRAVSSTSYFPAYRVGEFS